jgi:benzoate membrane transport protein
MATDPGVTPIVDEAPAGEPGSRWGNRISPMIAGALVIIVGYSGPVLIIQQAAINAGLSERMAGSWLFTVSSGAGLAGLVLSLWLRQPIIVAFSSAGAVLLTTSLAEYSLPEAIGAYLFVSLGCVAIGWSSTFSRLMARIPGPIVSAMLAGVLFRFGTGYFAALPGDPERVRVTALVVAMGAVYFAARSLGSRLAVVWTSAVGIVAAVVLRLTTDQSIELHLVRPEAVAPAFHFGAIIGLGLPLLAIALSSQYAPGYGVLKEAGYEPRMNPILIVTGGIGGALAFFGCSGINLAAITAGLATGSDAHPDPERRYIAGVWAGVFYIAVGLLGISALSIFGLMPKEFVAAVTGLALFSTIVNSAGAALADPTQRDAAGATLLCAASGFTLFHVGAPFWALVIGLAVAALGRLARRRKAATST